MSVQPVSAVLSPAVTAVLAELGDVPVVTDRAAVRRRSRDFFWYSPILDAELKGLSAEAVVRPRDEADVITLAGACARHGVPVTVRGGGTGNYGQAVPLKGGIVLDMTALDAVEWVKPGAVRVQAGRNILALDEETRRSGWELRMHPSTKRTATIGGFIAGGSGGVGSVTYGGLREPGNLHGVRVVTLEESPRVLELRGNDAQVVNRAYGTTGIITALELPLAPAFAWVDVVVAFDDFLEAVAFGLALASADGITKKLVTPISWPLPSYFPALGAACPPGRHLIVAMIAPHSLESFRALLSLHKGVQTYEAPSDESPTATPLYEYAWNHTTLQVLKVDRGVTYLQCLYPADRILDSVAEIRDLFGDEVIPHLEFIRFNGRITCSALPVVRYTTPERMTEIIDAHEARGVFIANPHVYTLEDGSRHKRVDADQLGFKQAVDPKGLLNPGKMRTFVPLA